MLTSLCEAAASACDRQGGRRGAGAHAAVPRRRWRGAAPGQAVPAAPASGWPTRRGGVPGYNPGARTLVCADVLVRSRLRSRRPGAAPSSRCRKPPGCGRPPPRRPSRRRAGRAPSNSELDDTLARVRELGRRALLSFRRIRHAGVVAAPRGRHSPPSSRWGYSAAGRLLCQSGSPAS